VIYSCFNIPKKIDSSIYPNDVLIIDNADILDNEISLKNSLETFKDKTGIIPVILTINNEDWIENYTDLETYAYEAYVTRFDDEIHWLIVYSEPENPDPFFNDWYWEGMQGDDTDNILTVSVTNKFNTALHKNFLREAKVSKSDAFINAFDTITPHIMRISFNALPAVISFVIAFIFLFLIFMGLDINPKRDKYFSQAVKCPNNFVDQEACEYCKGIYVIGIHTKCPHCGAPVKPHDYTVNEKGEVTSIIK